MPTTPQPPRQPPLGQHKSEQLGQLLREVIRAEQTIDQALRQRHVAQAATGTRRAAGCGCATGGPVWRRPQVEEPDRPATQPRPHTTTP